jgi:hypothetical protein
MFTAPESDPVTFWQPSFSQPNAVIAAPAKSPLAAGLASLWPPDSAVEVVHVYTAADALTLVERGRIGILALVEPFEAEGWTQLLAGALARSRTPRVVLLSSKAPYETRTGWLRMRATSDAASLRSLVVEAAAESQRGPDRLAVRPIEVLAAAAPFPEAAWLRFTGDAATGDICFRNGVAVYAETGRKNGRAALDEILAWPHCEFEYREYPSVLPSNVNVLLADLTRPQAGGARPAPEPAAVEMEEPTDFPDFAAATVPSDPQDVAWPEAEPPVPEPEEFALGGVVASHDQDWQEPQAESWPGQTVANWPEQPAEDWQAQPAGQWQREPEAAAAPGADVPGAGVPSADVDLPETLDVFEMPASAQLASPDLRSTIFTSVAVLEDGVVELCEPPSGYKEFDPSSICHTFNGIRQIVESRGMGATNSVLIRATQSSLVVAQVPGAKRVLAAKFSGLRFGAAEEMELHRLLENAAILSPAAVA